tara:strand:+ start:1255 stop:2271 length:1017 start_codon:yes stop_codon:yes gene_type:complete
MPNILKDNIAEVYSTIFKNNSIANCAWILNRYCNYSCSYCWPFAHQKEKDFLTEDQYLVAVDKIINEFYKNNFKIINWGMMGGEVTFNPHYLTILDEIQTYVSDENKMATNLVSNMSHLPKWWEKFIKNTEKFAKVKVNGSLHTEYINDDDKLDKFREKLSLLKSCNIDSVANYVMLPGKMEYAKKLLNFFGEKQIFVLIKGCRANNGFIDGYTKEEINFLNTSSQEQSNRNNSKYLNITEFNGNEHWFNSVEELIAKNGMSYEGFYCTAGMQGIVIYENGDVVRGRVCKGEKLGNIKTGFTLFNEVKKCIQKRNCHCAGDVKMPKWRNNENSMLKVG